MRDRSKAIRWRGAKIALGLFAIVMLALFVLWRGATDRGGQVPADPFRIGGNLYYVGANDVASLLVTGDEGHVLIDGGYPATSALIEASIAELGFDIRDVKVILNTHWHYDHAGGLAELQRRSGAKVLISAKDAPAVAAGGMDDTIPFPFRLIHTLRIARYTPPRIDGTFGDGTILRLGDIRMKAHVIGGHTRGCTMWEIPVTDGARSLTALELCSLGVSGMDRLVAPESYAGIRTDYARSFARIRRIAPDIFLTPHGRSWGRYRKYKASLSAADPVDAFIDREGLARFVDLQEADFRAELARQQRKAAD